MIFVCAHFFIHPGFGFAAMSYPRFQNEAAPMANGYTWDIQADDQL
jgi:hypothetical protein